MADVSTRIEIALDHLQPNPYQKRKKFDVTELAAGIKSLGFMGAIWASEIPGEPGFYYIVAGERRVRACRLLGMDTIPAEVFQLNEEELEVMCAVENILREDLTFMEEAQTYQGMLNRLGSIDAVVAKVGKVRTTVEKRLALLTLTPAVQEMVDSGKVSLQQAELLREIADPAEQVRTAELAIRGNMDVNRLANLVKQKTGGKGKGKKASGDGTGERRVTLKEVSTRTIAMSEALEGYDFSASSPEDAQTLISQFEVLQDMLAAKLAELGQRQAA